MRIPTLCLAFTAAFAVAASVPAFASPINIGPPVGAILDLNGLPIPGAGNGMTTAAYAQLFTATDAATTLTLAFRDDGAFVDLYTVVLRQCLNVACSSSGVNLLLNPSFNTTVYTQNGNSAVPTDWSYDNIYGASFGGQDSMCTLGDCWHDGATQAYDAISQSVATTAGDEYVLGLLLAEDNNTTLAFNGSGFGYTNFSQLSTNGDNTADGGHDGNAIDVLAYALPGENEIPSPVPEPAAWLLLATGLLGLGVFWRQFQTQRGL
ncbi:MAG: PEP-CTERM sorting domain-containing protein [Terriglobales bacterium]